MCGIAGLVNYRGKEPWERILNPMLRSMHHRGPDATGIYHSDTAGLGHARLSIIDLAGGHQPIANEARNIWVVFNGEIFNYPELTASLTKMGHRFHTRSDTEVLVHLYETYGCDFFNHLNGQFAIALWDETRQTLLLGRDRMGIRPLFYHHNGHRLHFASEIKSLFTDQRVSRRLERRTLADVFTCWTPVAGDTAFEQIHQIPPAHYALFSPQGFQLHRYWRLDFTEAPPTRGETDWAEEMAHLIQDAARIRLRADVPVGAYLSGGIDSTYISTLVRKNFNNNLKTFSVQFADKRFDESRYQQMAVEAIGVDHRAILCTDEIIGDLFPKVVWHAETPMIRTAPAPLMMLSGLVRSNHFKVVLTGEGADELFAGYNIFKETMIRRFWARRPESVCRPYLLKKLYPYIFDDNSGKPNAFLIGFFKKDLTLLDSPVYSHLVRWRNTGQLRRFFTDDVLSTVSDTNDFIQRVTAGLPDTFNSWSPLSRAQYLEINLFLSNYLLSTQGDRMSMANSVEGRYPFLDHRVVELAARTPANLRLNGLTEKYLLKRMSRGMIPEQLIARSKQPYRAPISHCFMQNKAPDYVSEMLSEQNLKGSGLFKTDQVRHLVAKCRQNDGKLVSERENMALAAILSTQLLNHQFIENFPVWSDDAMPHAVSEIQGVAANA